VRSHANLRRDEPIAVVQPKRHEVLGIVSLAGAFLLGIALASFDVRGGADWAGPVGLRVSEALVAFLGSAAALLPLSLALLAVRLFRRTVAPFQLLRVRGTLALVAVVATALHLWLGERPMLGGLAAGGLLGSTLGEGLRATVGTAGANTLVITALLVALVLRTRLSVLSIASGAQVAGVRGGALVRNGVKVVASAWREARAAEGRNKTDPDAPHIVAPEEQVERALGPLLNPRTRRSESPDPDDDSADSDPTDSTPVAPAVATAAPPAPPRRALQRPLRPAVVDEPPPAPAPAVVARKAPPRPALRVIDEAPAPREVAVDVDDAIGMYDALATADDPAARPARRGGRRAADVAPEAPRVVAVVEAEPAAPRAPRRASVPPPAPSSPPPPWDADDDDVLPPATEADLGPLTIVSHAREIEQAMREATVAVERSPVVPPPSRSGASEPARPLEMPSTELLTAPPTARVGFDESQLRATADRLIQTLTDYSIDGRVMEIHPGPVVTTYEVLPAAGTKLSKIVRLSDDLAMSLEASKVRIVAPIPGKGRVGFEIPNAVRQTVYFREMVETEAFQKLGGALPVALGKDVVGAPFYADLATMPHLIVAGATGAGKSVGLNVMLTSLLYKRGPEDVRLLMIDPKMVELAVYDGIPHMLLPVVTDMKKATLALRWVVDEMERRYHLFAQTGSRNITTYNERVAKALAEDKPLRGADGPVRMKQTGTTVAVTDADAPAPVDRPQKLPYILCVVDEFADLIMVAGKDIEAAVARLAQKARAAGIHVILATQRPSVDVITGMIKANFPARIAFKVSQRVDSRTILDQQGAEHLLGRGDMLILPPGASDLRRVHCAFVNEDEVQRVTDHWRAQARPNYDEDILKPRDDEEDGGADNGPAEIKVPQEKYERAVNLVITSRKCSVSYVQRYLGIGYNVAARIVDKMEREGIVGAPKGPGKEREVLG